jgi:beta-galactosidase
VKRVLFSALASALVAAGAATSQPEPDRYRRFIFGVDYYPEQWPEEYWERDARRMKDCGVNVVRMAEFAWSLMEPREGVYDFSLFDRVIALLGRQGIATILGTPTATPPKWLTHAYPEVLHVFKDGRPANDQSRRHYCYNSPAYRRFSRRIVEEMARHYERDPNVIGWQIDNEFNNENPECYSDSCRLAYRGWLRSRYGTLEALNERWGTRFWSQLYTRWDEIDLPFPTTSLHHPALMLDFKRFLSDSVISYQKDQVEAIRRSRPQDFITQNGVFKNVDYFKLSRDVDIFSRASYPLFDAAPQYSTGASLTLARGFRNRMMVMEQQTGPGGQTYLLRSPRPGEMSLWAFQSIAHGAEGIVHFRWRTARRGIEEYWFGVLDHDDVPRARYAEFKKEAGEINKLGAELLGSTLVADIAVIKDYEAEWVYDHQYFTSEVNVGAAYVHLFRAASELKHTIDFIEPTADFRRYKLIFAPYLILMDEALAAKIRDFVVGGGTFVMSAHAAVKDRDNAMTDQTWPIMGLKELFGVEVESFNCYQPPAADKNSIRFADGSTAPVNVFADILKAGKAQTIGTWERDFFKGTAALTENHSGSGRAVYYASFFNVESARYLLERYAEALGLKPLFAGFPREVEVTRRTKGAVQYYFILNHADAAVTVAPGRGYRDALSDGKEAPASLTLAPFGYAVLAK